MIESTLFRDLEGQYEYTLYCNYCNHDSTLSSHSYIFLRAYFLIFSHSAHLPITAAHPACGLPNKRNNIWGTHTSIQPSPPLPNIHSALTLQPATADGRPLCPHVRKSSNILKVSLPLRQKKHDFLQRPITFHCDGPKTRLVHRWITTTRCIWSILASISPVWMARSTHSSTSSSPRTWRVSATTWPSSVCVCQRVGTVDAGSTKGGECGLLERSLTQSFHARKEKNVSQAKQQPKQKHLTKTSKLHLSSLDSLQKNTHHDMPNG